MMAGLVPFKIVKPFKDLKDRKTPVEIRSIKNKDMLVATVSNEHWAKFIVEACNAHYDYKKSLKEANDINEPLLMQRNRHFRTANAIEKTLKEMLDQLMKDAAETKKETEEPK